MISVIPAGVISNCSSVPASRSFTIVVDAVMVPFMISSVPSRPVTMNQVLTPPGLYRSVGMHGRRAPANRGRPVDPRRLTAARLPAGLR